MNRALKKSPFQQRVLFKPLNVKTSVVLKPPKLQRKSKTYETYVC